ncbi:DUF29 domain-containing protein [Salmonella enterica subsp. enterica serovar Panama]|uniref:DUF29 domain-containing protein n=1 Tax=Salmonella enterica subsp. enterica serovar Panama TaxID=29472 RepID=A0A636GFK0_SALET|nr:DUF29 domain-containing protein [Salmonella enterica subsp. enterica serovar Panama]EDI0274283.1 DUF29 domain-containing protein [Salmonella enterica subsp. enterica serovar Panama]
MGTRYETDFYGWAQEQAGLLRSGQLSELDTQNLLEEIEAMGTSAENELESRLEVLFIHLLKWKFQSEIQGRSWKLTIEEQRRKIERRLKKSPSLKHKLPEILEDAYGDAIIGAERETNIKRNVFPDNCPWTFEQIINPDFYPD